MIDQQPSDEHERAQAAFSEYVDGELVPPARAELEAHLGVCERCRGELESFRTMVQATRGAPRGQASPEFMDNLRGQIRIRSRGRFFGQRRSGYRLEIASLIMLIIAAAIYLGLRLAQPLLNAP